MFQSAPQQIEQFVSSLFRYADEDSFISFRAFDQFERGTAPVLIKSARVGSNIGDIVTEAATLAERVANLSKPSVFAPPVATFNNPSTARDEDVSNGVALSVEVDQGDTVAARRALEAILGPVTIAVHSGGEWIDEYGEVFPKVHLHWRLSEPTRTKEEHARLKEARWYAAALVKADLTAAPPCHPLRWPGSWNMKSAPKLAVVAAGNPASEIHLPEALERLQEAVEVAGYDSTTRKTNNAPGADPQAATIDIASALQQIPNESVHWDEWNRTGMATYRATGGTADGLAAWSDWSAKSDKHEDRACELRWQHYHTSPPTKIGAGTLFYMAQMANPLWTKPSLRASAAADTSSGADPQQKTDLPLLWFDDIEPCLDVRDFVQGVLVEQGAAVVYGESNAGKTFWTTDLALHVAAGMPWNGRRIEAGGVIYCVLEGGAGFRNRVAAWRSKHAMNGKELPFAAIPASLNLLHPSADTPRLVAAIKAAAERIGGPVKLVVIDTLSRALAGGNENAPDDMGALVGNMDTIRTATGASVLFVHHSGKDQAKGARGHSLLRAAVDTEIEVAADEDTPAKTATVAKQRELKKGDVFGFTLETVELGRNRHGEAVTTCIVIPSEGEAEPIQRDKGRRPNPNGQLGARALRIAIGKSGAYLPENDEYPHRTLAVSATVWRDEFYQLKAGSPDNNRQAFNRAETTLLASNIITARNGLVWFVLDQKRDN